MSDVRVLVDRVLFDPNIGASVMLLKEKDGERVLPVWIGKSEALSIAMAIEKVTLTRPMTHDLIQSILKNLDVSVSWVRVRDLDEGTFFATIKLTTTSAESVDIDARPSDAVALAIRMEAPIFVAEQVLSVTISAELNALERIENLDEDILSDLPDEVFGKYKM